MKNYFLIGVLRATGFLCVAYAAFLIAPEIEGRFNPPLTDFRPGDVMVQGADVLIANAHVRKARNCQVIQPWRAQGIRSGRMLQVIRDKNDGPNWSKGEDIAIAPFIVIGATGEPFRLFAEHKCPPGLWSVFSELAVINPK